MKSHSGAVSSDSPATPHPAPWLTPHRPSASCLASASPGGFGAALGARGTQTTHRRACGTVSLSSFLLHQRSSFGAGPSVPCSPPAFPGLGLGLCTGQILRRDLFSFISIQGRERSGAGWGAVSPGWEQREAGKDQEPSERSICDFPKHRSLTAGDKYT